MRAVLALQYGSQLRCGHGVGRIAQAAQQVGKLCWQHPPWLAASIDISWHTFITAPRMADTRSARRLALAGVNMSCDRSGLSP